MTAVIRERDVKQKQRKEKKDEKDVFDSSSNVLHDSGIC